MESSINQLVMLHVIIILNFADPTINLARWIVESTTDGLLSTCVNAKYKNAHAKTLTMIWQEQGKIIKTTRDLLEYYYLSITVV